MTAFKVKAELKGLSNPERAQINLRYFKTGKGEYGEGDVFMGVRMPDMRKVAQKYVDLDYAEVKKLLDSKIHEHRMLGLLILVYRYEKADEILKRKIYDFYLTNLKAVNNWDLVDSSAHKIMGAYLLNKPVMRKVLYNLAKSKDMWERRVAILSTFWFIKHDQFLDTLSISEILLEDKEDLMHKAVGWMLREMGKKDVSVLFAFLDKYSQVMPRTMLRYAIEKLDEDVRKSYMAK